MQFDIYIEPHERYEALEAYADWLSATQVDEIKDAPESALIRIRRGVGQPMTTVWVIEEG